MKNNNGICYIVGAGDFKNPFTPTDKDLVIAADGGFDILKAKGIRCDLLIGDLDSIESIPEDTEMLRHPVMKDETDMHLCYLEGKRRGFSIFRIFGGSGGRPDHTFANYCLLYNICKSGDVGIMSDGEVHTRVIKDEKISLKSEFGANLSIFAFGGNASRVNIKNAKYSAENTELDMSFPLGVSNSFIDTDAEVEVKSGALLIIWEATDFEF